MIFLLPEASHKQKIHLEKFTSLRGRYNLTAEVTQHKMMEEWEKEVSFCKNVRVAFPFESLGQYIKQNLFKQKNSYCIGGNSCQNIPFVLFKPAS